MDTIQYSPVLIPTLNRYDHFKLCLESLEKCTGADQTEVYIGLDYPPSQKYMEGWSEIDRYLRIKEAENCFLKLIVQRHKENKGESENIRLLKKIIFEKNDSYIVTEDDNVFSPCFLEYMNKGMKKYQKDKRIIAVCGYTHESFYNNDSCAFCSIDTPVYGIGFWKWQDVFLEERRYKWLYHQLKSSFIKTLRLYFRYPAVIYMGVSTIWKRFDDTTDVLISIINLLQNTYVICPSMSLVRNIGADGSGLHSGFVAGREHQEIMQKDHFEFDDIEIKTTKNYEKQLFKLNMPTNWIIRQFVFIQRFFVVMIFLVFDRRKHADDPFNWFISFFFNSWNRLKELKWKIKGTFYRKNNRKK